jgi:hypothetical protein
MREPTLAIYTVYASPRDYPGEYVARRSLIDPAGSIEPDREICARSHSLTMLRAALPPGLYCLPRNPNDDPAIVECWL